MRKQKTNYYYSKTGQFMNCYSRGKYPREKRSSANRAKQFSGIHKKADTSIGNVWFADPHKKIGRNSQCHCGSGQKYKKCCGGNK